MSVNRYTLETRHHELSGMGGDTDLWENSNGEWVRFKDYADLQRQLAEAREAWQIRNNDACRLEQEIESHAWEISPAMAQAKIDELNRQIAELKSVLAEIANQDYRGNRSTQSTIAYNALMKIAKEASNG